MTKRSAVKSRKPSAGVGAHCRYFDRFRDFVTEFSLGSSWTQKTFERVFRELSNDEFTIKSV